MGGIRRKKKKMNQLKKAQAQPDENLRNKGYRDIIRENQRFIDYYKERLNLTESEFSEMVKALQRDLPTTFRISSNSTWEINRLKEILQSETFSTLLSEGDGLKQLPWYPDLLAYQLNVSRRDIRRSELYYRLHNFLISGTESGSLSRQETVSMIPPVLLKVEPNHSVIDLCAAPGSKTAQIIEAIQKSEGEGFVIANDIDNTRCYMLVHQAKRLNSPCCIITNHDASIMPNMLKPDGSILQYDRVLCDVPCSGDGTMRKNPDIWAKWSHVNASSLHGVQYRILKRGAELLKVGGRVVYSTCSLNPIENEAVIHRILVESKGSLILEDVSNDIKGLKYKGGVTQFNPIDKDQAKIFRRAGFNVKPEPEEEGAAMEEETSSKPLTQELLKCLRIYPHEGDTGAFFVAVLTKTNVLPWQKAVEESTNVIEEVAQEQSLQPPPKKRKRVYGYREDPYVFFKGDEEVWTSIRDFYDIHTLDPTCLLTRSVVGKKKNIYYTSPQVRDLVVANQSRLKVINTGVKAFARCDNKSTSCDFRLASEGLQSMLPFLKDSKRRLKLSSKNLTEILNCLDPTNPFSMDSLDESVRSAANEVMCGSCVLDGPDLSVVGWKGNKTLRAYTTKSDALFYLRLLGVDTSIYDVNKFKNKPNGDAEQNHCHSSNLKETSSKEEEEEETDKVQTEE